MMNLKGCAFAAAVLGMAACAGAQTSRLYLTEYGTTNAYIVQGGSIVGSFSRTASDDGPALAILGTVRMYGQYGGAAGREYDLNGNLIGGSYLNTGFVDCYDGATDGGHNFTISHNDFGNNFAVIAGDASWGGMAVSFVPQRRSSGITFDPTDGTLWITNNVGGSDRVQHYTVGGSLLGEFGVDPNLVNGGGYAIALDLADQTLWIPGAFGSANLLYQYDKAGNLLNTLSVPGLGNIVGAEFGAVPEPASMLVLVLGAGLLARRRR